MIIATIDLDENDNNKHIFRGKPISFWIQEFFPKLNFISFNPIPASFDFILFFHTDYFFTPLKPTEFSKLSKFLNGIDPNISELYSLPKFPFIAMSNAFYKKYKKTVKPGFYSQLSHSKLLKYFPISIDSYVYHPKKMALKIEECIINYQIEILLKRNIWIQDYHKFYLEAESQIGNNCKIGSGVVIIGNTIIGCNVHIYPHCYIENSCIGDNSILFPGTIVINSRIEKNVCLGPYTHLRNDTLVKKGAKIGNFVEMKKSIFGEGSKAMHLSYIGDATVGKSVNIGAGTITCNFDGEKKNPTFIEDNVFIGSGSELIAPVKINKNAYVAAGSTITDDVPENALGIARQRQTNIDKWVLKKRKKK